MTPDDRAEDLVPLGGEIFGAPLTGRPLPPSTAAPSVRADAFAGRVYELTTMHGMNPDAAVKRTYREFDRIHAADEKAPGLSDLTRGQKAVLIGVLLGILSFIAPVLGWTVSEMVIPAYEWGFGRWL